MYSKPCDLTSNLQNQSRSIYKKLNRDLESRNPTENYNQKKIICTKLLPSLETEHNDTNNTQNLSKNVNKI